MEDSVERANNSIAVDLRVDAPESVDAGSTFTATAYVATAPIADLRGTRLDVRNGEEVVASTELVDVDDDGIHASAPIVLTAPETPGTQVWTFSIGPGDPELAPHDAAEDPLQVTVTAHDTRVQAWGAPSAVLAGAPFRIMVGIKCSSGCDMSGRGFDIVDADGTKLATGAVGSETWRSTKGLFYAEVELTAPAEEGHTDWQVLTHPSDASLPHAEGATQFGVTTVPAPEHRVRVTALDVDKKEPIEGLQVLMHPFRAFTDENGVAEVRVPGGEYRLYVSGLRYWPHDSRVDIDDDFETTVELEWEDMPHPIR